MAALLASMSWRLTSKASAAAKPTFFKVLISSSKLAIALLKPSLAFSCSSNAALLAFTSALMALTTSAVFTNASLFSVTALVKSSRVSSCAVTTSFKPIPSKSAFSTSSCVAVLIDLIPFLSVTTISSPSTKPLSAWAFSADASAACSAAASRALVRPTTPLLALSALSATASILEAASTALSAASLASFTLLSTLAESAVTLSSAALAAALASAVSCARLSTRVFTAVTSSLTFSMDSESSDEALEISLSTSSNLVEISATDSFSLFTPVATSAIRVPLVVMAVFSSSMVSFWSSKAAAVSFAKLSRPPAKPTPFRLSASISSLVALRTVLLPLASVVMKSEPEAKPLMVCSNSKVFKSRASLSFLKVSLPVSLSYVVPSPKTVKNAAWPWSSLPPTAAAKFCSAAPAAPLATAAVTAMLNTFTLNFFMFFTFVWWV